MTDEGIRIFHERIVKLTVRKEDLDNEIRCLERLIYLDVSKQNRPLTEESFDELSRTTQMYSMRNHRCRKKMQGLWRGLLSGLLGR